MVIDDETGNVGINELTPSGKLHVTYNSSTSSPHLLLKESGSNDGSRLDFLNNNPERFTLFGKPEVADADATFHIYYSGYGNILTAKGDGKVGIGDTSPDTRLHVNGNENDGITASLKVTSGSQNMLIDGNEIDVTQTGLYLNNNTNLNVILATGGGNVGIETASPDNKLDVLGIIRANEVIVETGWADYVFADDYQLDDLSKVETFIRENKHLPNVPSAAEIQDKGAHVSALMTKMMEKIEELTLYTIKQQKEIDALKVQLQNK